MKQIIGTYGSLIILLLLIFLCMSMNVAPVETAEAKEFKASVIAEIENSNFNPNVIDACKAQALSAGYNLTLENCQYDENNFISSAEVVLSYTYRVPGFNITETKSTRGIAK